MTFLRFLMLSFIVLAMGLGIGFSSKSAHADTSPWNGFWFECEFSGHQAPPGDDCAMLDDDGFLFEEDRVTHVKVINSTETDACKKQRAGQCFRADKPEIIVDTSRKGKAIFTKTTIGMRFLACTQIFHMLKVKIFYEAHPNEERCIWAGEKYFYLRKYDGNITIKD